MLWLFLCVNFLVRTSTEVKKLIQFEKKVMKKGILVVLNKKIKKIFLNVFFFTFLLSKYV